MGISRQNAGLGSGGAIVLNSIANKEDLDRPAFLMINGDVSYACGSAWLHEKFHEIIAPIVARVPLSTPMGNHEFDHGGQGFKPSWGDFGEDSGGDCGIPYRARWQMPEADIPSSAQF